MELLIMSAILSVITSKFIDLSDNQLLSATIFFAWVGFLGTIHFFIQSMIRAYHRHQHGIWIKSRLNKYK